VIGYDKDEQRSLATSVQSQVFRYQRILGDLVGELRTIAWQAPLRIASFVLLVVLISFVAIRVKRFGWQGLRLRRKKEGPDRSAIIFYERLTALLAKRGIHRPPEQTPLEFASTVGLKEALTITGAYNRVRYGSHELSRFEREQIEEILTKLEKGN
jgi:hypothetical protein